MNNGISVIIPSFNECDNLKILIEKIETSLKEKTYELILVDDGSTDDTEKLLNEICKTNNKIKYIKLKSNYGKTEALKIGFGHAKYEYLLTIDADLQNSPNDLLKIIEKLDEGFDVVGGYRVHREEKFLKKIPSLITNNIFTILLFHRVFDIGCGLKGLRKNIINKIEMYGDLHRFIIPQGIINKLKVVEIEVSHSKRMFGESKYKCTKIFPFLRDFLSIKYFRKATTLLVLIISILLYLLDLKYTKIFAILLLILLLIINIATDIFRKNIKGDICYILNEE